MVTDTKDKSTLDAFATDKSVLSAGAALAAQRKTVEKRCEYCGKPFKGIQKRKFCNATCRNAYWRQKNKEEL